MSRGLGKVERYALAYLRENDGSRFITARDIAQRRAHDEWLAAEGRPCEGNHACCDDPSYDPTPSEYEAMRRAIRSLERKGLVWLRWGEQDFDPQYLPRPSLCAELTTYGRDVVGERVAPTPEATAAFFAEQEALVARWLAERQRSAGWTGDPPA